MVLKEQRVDRSADAAGWIDPEHSACEFAAGGWAFFTNRRVNDADTLAGVSRH